MVWQELNLIGLMYSGGYYSHRFWIFFLNIIFTLFLFVCYVAWAFGLPGLVFGTAFFAFFLKFFDITKAWLCIVGGNSGFFS